MNTHVQPRLIKRYGGTRLYDTALAAYLSDADLQGMILDGVRFTVRDAATGEDVTPEILDRLQ